ncbi:hypothetical protein GFM13_29080 [Rhizobium leguminosarum bv. viciae]|nr:hypothetical protein [Rhizobium leguminosarum bv. viciae]
MMMTYCQGCDKELTTATDSEAHIIPNALGGNLKPRGIICRTCNGKLDTIADNRLIKAFGDWPTLLDIPRDRGSNPSKNVETRNGRRVRIEANGALTRSDILYSVEGDEERSVVKLGAGDWKTFNNLLQRVAKQFPQFEPAEALKHARKVDVDDGDELKLGIDFHPRAVFGGIVAAIWLFMNLKTGIGFCDWERLLVAIRKIQRNGGLFRYMTEGFPGLVGPEIPICHKIVLRSNPATRQLLAYVEILGVLRVGGLVGEGGDQPLEHIYVYDVFNRTDRSAEFSINDEAFTAIRDWRSVGLGPEDSDALRAHFESALSETFAQRYYDRFSASGDRLDES